MSKIEFILDLAHQDLNELPDYILDKPNLKLLYLEDNNLEKLPLDLFVCLENLVWLDLRCNKLSSLPCTISYHKCLETLLLQDNYFEELPTELGLVKSLKVIQLSGNPIKYPERKILEAGTQSILDFLRQEHYEQKKLEENSSDETLDDISDESFLKVHDIPTSSTVISPRVIIEPAKKNLTAKVPKTKTITTKYVPKKFAKLNIYQNKPHYNSNKYVKSQIPKNSQTHLKYQTAKDMWLNALKLLLNKQEEIVQREKYVPQYKYTIFENLEELQNWRKTVNERLKDTADYKLDVPFDTDQNYSRMLSRKDLKKPDIVKKPYQPKPKLDLEKLISDIADSLKLIDNDRDEDKAPSSHMDLASREIKWILDLQKRLSVLKLQNDSEIQ